MEKKTSNKIRPAAVEAYKRKAYDPEDPDLPPDWMALLSLLFGIAGFFMKYKWTNEFDFKQQLMSFLFSVAGLMMNYFGPNAYEIKKAEM
eukprot:g684.t1